MLQERILEAARPYLEGRTVTDLVLGIALIGAELDEKNVGVSWRGARREERRRVVHAT